MKLKFDIVLFFSSSFYLKITNDKTLKILKSNPGFPVRWLGNTELKIKEQENIKQWKQLYNGQGSNKPDNLEIHSLC